MFIFTLFFYLFLSIHSQRISIILAYVRTNQRIWSWQKTWVLWRLKEITSTIPQKQDLYIGADFNARVGRTKQGDDEWNRILGNFGHRKLNDNGLYLLEYCTQNDLRICTSFFKHCYYGTWQNPRTKAWHQIDYILCQCNMSHLITDCFV